VFSHYELSDAKLSKNFKIFFLTLTLVVRVNFYNVLAAVGNRDADFRKARGTLGIVLWVDK